MLNLIYSAFTHPGRVREGNEDNFYINGIWCRDIKQGTASCSGSRSDGYLLASVCDGMGGQELGEVASLVAVETMSRLYDIPEPGRPKQLFQADPKVCTDIANNRICDQMRSTGKRIGTTMSVLEFSNDTVTAVNLGDSRIYRMRGKVLQQISVDHTVVGRMVQQGMLTKEEAMVHPMRHRITQYLGIFPDEMILEPAVSGPIKIQSGDRYLICSDGLTDMLKDDQIAELMCTTENLDELTRKLGQAALDAGGKDNVTIVMIEAERKSQKRLPFLVVGAAAALALFIMMISFFWSGKDAEDVEREPVTAVETETETKTETEMETEETPMRKLPQGARFI